MDYFGYATIEIRNRFFRMDALKDAGPRICRFIPAGTELNLLAEVPDAVAETPWGVFHFQGGHRLWHAPEALPRSYDPDDRGVKAAVTGSEMLLAGPVEAHTGIRKTILATLLEDQPVVMVEHILDNQGLWPVELAPWAITQMRMGGEGILPLRKPGKIEGLLPDRQVAIWPYTDLADPRLHRRNDYFVIDAISNPNAFKLGSYNPCGWVAYRYQGFLLVKYFEPVVGRFVDFGCNTEIYVRDLFLEIESQGPLRLLEPGSSLQHVEKWELIRVDPSAEVDAVLRDSGLIK